MAERIIPAAEGVLRQAVDPLHNLPYIELQPSREQHLHPEAANYRIIHETGDLGEMTIIGGDPEHYVSRLNLDVEPYRKYRVGMAVLTIAAEHAHKEGADLRTDPAGEYLEQLMLWQAMVDRGVAVVAHPFAKRPALPHQRVPLVHRGGHIRIPQVLPPTVPVELPASDNL